MQMNINILLKDSWLRLMGILTCTASVACFKIHKKSVNYKKECVKKKMCMYVLSALPYKFFAVEAERWLL